jgi:hypothetical protein
VLGGTPGDLVNITFDPPDQTFARVDYIYHVNPGTIFLVAQVANPLNATVATFTVPPNVTTDLVGNPNLGASYTLV